MSDAHFAPLPAPEPANEPASGLAGAPDGLQRLWTPHRMAYIDANNGSGGEDLGCPFCTAPTKRDAESLIVHRGRAVFAVLNLFPYNPGHLLVCPYRHVADYTELTDAEVQEVADLTRRAIRAIRAVSHPAGFNLGVNLGRVAGAGVRDHFHQHVVPRWEGDANFFPIIAQTKAVPQLLADTRDLLSRAWS